MITVKTIRVVAAVLCDSLEQPTSILATARGYGDFKGRWEFPGGKLEPGETARQALVREIGEELGVLVEIGDFIGTVEYGYPDFHLRMDCFWCRVAQGTIVLKEAEAAKWLSKDELYSVDWLPADVTLIDRLAARMDGRQA